MQSSQHYSTQLDRRAKQKCLKVGQVGDNYNEKVQNSNMKQLKNYLVDNFGNSFEEQQTNFCKQRFSLDTNDSIFHEGHTK